MMKKHAGMVKSANSVEVSLNCKRNLESLIQLSDSAEEQSIVIDGSVEDFLNATSLVDQIAVVKKVSLSLQCAGVSTRAEVLLAIRFLITLYLDSSLHKTSLHKAISSSLSVCDNLPERLTAHRVNVEELILDSLQQVVDTQEYIVIVKGLIESPPGSCRYKAVIQNLPTFITNTSGHLRSSLQRISDAEVSKVDSSTHSKNVSVAHMTCQTFFRLLSISHLTVDLQSRECLESTVDDLQQTLLEGNGDMELLISVGLCIAQISHTLSDVDGEGSADIHLSRIKSLISSTFTTATQSHTAADVTSGSNLSESTSHHLSLSGSTCHHLSLCCLLNGVISCNKHHSITLHQLILSTALQLMEERMYTNAQLVFIKMMATWTASFRQRISTYREFVESHVYPPVFNYLLFVWEHSTETIRQSSREVYANLLACIRTVEHLRVESLNTIMSYPWSRKGKYGFLMEYVQLCGMDEILQFATGDGSVASLLSNVIVNIGQQQLANYVSELICCMMSSDRKSHDYTQEEWMQRWLRPLIDVIKRQPNSYKHVGQNLLPKIIKIWPDTIVELLKWLSTSGRCDESALDIYLMLSRRARTCGLLKEHVQEGDIWCQVLSRKLIQGALHLAHSERRLAAFALVCESHKTTSPITDYEFTWVNDFIRDNSFHEEASFRQQMLSHLKHFLYHVLEWSRKLTPEQQQPAKEFLKTLGSRQIQRLRSSSIANHKSVALDILTLLSQIFPYGTFTNSSAG